MLLFSRFHIPRGEGVIAWNQLPQHNFPEPARGLLFNGPTQDVSLASLCSYIFGHMIFTLFQLCFMRFSGAFLQSFSTDIFFDAGSKSEEEKIERVFLFVIDCVRGVMSYRFGRWVHDVPTTYVCLQYRSHRHQSSFWRVMQLITWQTQ